jgi:ABC-type glycerol-3-phosphate transport system permease component
MTTLSQPPVITAPGKPAPPRRPARQASASRTSLQQSIIAYLILGVGSLAFLIPFYFAANGSLQSGVDVLAGRVSPPKSWHEVLWQNYPRSLDKEHLDFKPAFANTVVITTLCVIGQIISCSLVGMGFARFKFRGRTILFMVMLSTMMLPGQVTMIPLFVLFRSLHMVDTFLPLIIPAWLASPFFVFMFRQFFSQIPEELIEAARMDGASNWRIYWQIMLPLSGPVIAIVAIYTFLGTWNDFLGPLIYLNGREHRTLAIALNAFKGSQYGGASEPQLLLAASVVCMLPCLILFFAAQRYFVESVAMTGGKS